jgi:glycosyltransferase involved in cell wall biosynthesis
MPLKVIFCVPTRKKPHPRHIESLEKSIPLIVAAGYDEGYTFEAGNPYISGSRAACLRRALDAKGDIFIFLDDDVSWEPEALLTLIDTPGDVVGGTYLAKDPNEVNYMGRILQDENGIATSIRGDGCIECACLPAGFLKVTAIAVAKFMRGYPELCFGPPFKQSVDLFNHGAHKGLWWGEDYAFCRRWRELGEKVWLIPNLNIDHNEWENDKVWKGNFHEYLMGRPGGLKDPEMIAKRRTVDPFKDFA